MENTFSEAARQLGHKSRATLYRCRDDGRLAGYLTADGGLDMEPEGLPPLAEHLAGVVQQQRPKGSDRGQLEAELAGERTRKLRLENDEREGQLLRADELAPVLFAACREARDGITRLPLQLAHEAVALGLPSEQRFALERSWAAAVDQALETYSKALLGPVNGEHPRAGWMGPRRPVERTGTRPRPSYGC